jgi:hypothetical protein
MNARQILRDIARRRVATLLLGAAIVALAAAPPARAQDPQSPPAVMQSPLRDPWLPPAVRKASVAAPTENAALRQQVERKLKAAFDAADTAHTGALTKEQAQAAGLGLVVRHFDEIDQAGTGAVRFEDYKRFLKSRGAKLD